MINEPPGPRPKGNPVPYREMDDLLQLRADFRGRSMHGRWCFFDERTDSDCLPLEFHWRLVTTCMEITADELYVVFSYGTPIGWEWKPPGRGRRKMAHFVPQIVYSQITTQHQKRMMRVLGWDIEPGKVWEQVKHPLSERQRTKLVKAKWAARDLAASTK